MAKTNDQISAEEAAVRVAEELHTIAHLMVGLHGLPRMRAFVMLHHPDSGALVAAGCLSMDEVTKLCTEWQKQEAELAKATEGVIHKAKCGDHGGTDHGPG